MPGSVSDPMPVPRGTEIWIGDARRLARLGICRDRLARLGELRGATAIAAFQGTARSGTNVSTLCTWAVDERRERALEAWLNSFAAHVDCNAEAFAPFGMGVTVVIGVEASGVLRCVTHSDQAADCRRMTGWSDQWVFAGLSRCPWETHLGVGNRGIPRGLTSAERERIAGLPQGIAEAWLDTAPEAVAA